MRIITYLVCLLFITQAMADVNIRGSVGGVTLPSSCNAGDDGISIDLSSKIITFSCNGVKYDCAAESIDDTTLAQLDFDNPSQFLLKCGELTKTQGLSLSVVAFYETLTDYLIGIQDINLCEDGCQIINFSYDSYTRLLTYFTPSEQDPELEGCYLQEFDKPVFTGTANLSIYACVNAVDNAGQIILTNGNIIFNDSFDG